MGKAKAKGKAKPMGKGKNKEKSRKSEEKPKKVGNGNSASSGSSRTPPHCDESSKHTRTRQQHRFFLHPALPSRILYVFVSQP